MNLSPIWEASRKIREDLAKEFGVEGLFWYVTLSSALTFLGLGFLVSSLVVVILVPEYWITVYDPALPVLFVLGLALVVVSLVVQYASPIGRRQIALAKKWRETYEAKRKAIAIEEPPVPVEEELR